MRLSLFALSRRTKRLPSPSPAQTPSTDGQSGSGDSSKRLPLRWAFIGLVAVAAGVLVGFHAGPAAGVATGIACAVGLNQIVD